MRKASVMIIIAMFLLVAGFLVTLIVSAPFGNIDSRQEVDYMTFQQAIFNNEIDAMIYLGSQGRLYGVYRDSSIKASEMPANYDLVTEVSWQKALPDVLALIEVQVDEEESLPYFSFAWSSQEQRSTPFSDYLPYLILMVICIIGIAILLFGLKQAYRKMHHE